MNKVIKIGLILPLITLMVWISSCDKIEEPFKPDYGGIDTSLYPGPGNYIIPPFGEFPSQTINVLIEDFTGHLCGNCPAAAVIAHDLKDQYPHHVIVASLHAATSPYSFQEISEPGDGVYPEYSHYFRTPAGDQYASDIPGFIGNPTGFINRVTDPNGDIWKFAPFWAEKVEEILGENEPLKMNVQVLTNYYTETRGLFVHVQSETLQDIEGRYNMVIYLIQDEYTAWQKDYTTNPQDIEFYEHKDVLIHNINGTWGNQLFDGNSFADDTYVNHFTYEVPDSIEVTGVNPNDHTGLSLIVYLSNRDTYEIVQVIQEEILITY
jgi:hypothetical protein